MVTVGMTSSMHLLMKLMTEVVYSSTPLDESRNIFQSVLAKPSCSVASASSNHFRRIEIWSDLLNGGRGRALYAALPSKKAVTSHLVEN